MWQQKEDSYLHPRQLDYKRSPETRKKSNKKTIKDAATVNTCTVKTHKPEIQSERERVNSRRREVLGAKKQKIYGGSKAEGRGTAKQDKRKSMEEKRRTESVEFYLQVSRRPKHWEKNHRRRNIWSSWLDPFTGLRNTFMCSRPGVLQWFSTPET